MRPSISLSPLLPVYTPLPSLLVWSPLRAFTTLPLTCKRCYEAVLLQHSVEHLVLYHPASVGPRHRTAKKLVLVLGTPSALFRDARHKFRVKKKSAQQKKWYTRKQVVGQMRCRALLWLGAMLLPMTGLGLSTREGPGNGCELTKSWENSSPHARSNEKLPPALGSLRQAAGIQRFRKERTCSVRAFLRPPFFALAYKLLLVL